MEPQIEDVGIEEKQREPEREERKIHAMPHDSMVTVRLSEPPPALTLNTSILDGHATIEEVGKGEGILGEDSGEQDDRPWITMMDPDGELMSPTGSESAVSDEGESRRASDSSEASEGGVNWEELEKTEEQEPRNQGSDDSTALLLARLEQENNLLATNPKSGLVKAQGQRSRGQSRPPSIQQLKKLVSGPTPSALRYSMIPAPPMTDLEFYAALVQDYTRTAQCLPTLLSKKVRNGVPPPLRGVVWQSMSGARDRVLEDQFDRLCGESSPYEGIIGKDLGRSFPGVEMFRDPDGDGQRMLGRVLKCFSLYDQKIGYCQGLGFLVGPLLMHMGDKQAFCVLVRLMEHYDLRNCFLPDLSGLLVRIHQFRELLKQHLPTLSAHLDALQIEPAYVSQWFLSFFAVTCPLPMLFRIYDVIFAEGASETIMRVALSLMRKNEEKILACTEIEDVMQLLLSRGLWDCYHYNADAFVNDFVSLTGVVTHETLQALEIGYRESQTTETRASSETIGSAASRFLGRLWAAGSNASTKSTNLSPSLVVAPSRPVSFLRRSTSKQSIASTLNSMEGGVADSILSASTEATSISRDSSNTDGLSIRGQSIVNVPKSNKDKNLHGQIEDLLTALSEMQRDHAILATQLQREREEREEDRMAVRSLVDGLKRKDSSETIKVGDCGSSQETIKETKDDVEEEPASPDLETPIATENDLSLLIELVEARFSDAPTNRRSSMLQTKSQLREELARSKEQLIIEVSKSQDFNRRLDDQQYEVNSLREQVREGHNHIRNAHQEKQRLEKQIHDLRVRKSAVTTPDGSKEMESEWPSRASGHGLRELKLGRTNSTRSAAPAFSKRTSSLNTTTAVARTEQPPALSISVPDSSSSSSDADMDALVLELVQAKTAEATAKQEAEEARAKLESLRKLLGMASPPAPRDGGSGSGSMGHRPSPSQPVVGFKRSETLNSLTSGPRASAAQKVDAGTPVSAVVGGFWGGWGKRNG